MTATREVSGRPTAWPLGMTEQDVRARWPGAIDALPYGADRLSIDNDDGGLWAGYGYDERTWWEDERCWSPLAAINVRANKAVR